MRLRPLGIPAIAVVAIVLLGAATAGVLAATAAVTFNPAAESKPSAAAVLATTPTATPPPVPIIAPSPEPAAESTPAPTAEPLPASTAAPTEPPLRLPDLPDPSKLQPLPTEPADVEGRSQRSASGQGTVHSWHDGDEARRVVLQTDLVAQETADVTASDIVVVKAGSGSIVRKQATHGSDAFPVFRSESGGGLMTLPGGVLLVLDADWDEATVESFFARNNISRDRTSELSFLPNGFRIETEPGFPSLELANALAAQDGVVLSSPNWWREIDTK